MPQEYNVSKRVEHGFKSLVHDGRTISAVSPAAYSRRFQAFLLNIFRPAAAAAAAAVGARDRGDALPVQDGYKEGFSRSADRPLRAEASARSHTQQLQLSKLAT